MTPDTLTLLAEAKTPQTLGNCPDGAVPDLMAALALKSGCAVFVAQDDATAATVLEAAPFFAKNLELVSFPAWDCLPFDRASPSPRIVAERLTALHRLMQKSAGPRLIVTTVNAILQRVLTPADLQKLVREVVVGGKTDREALLATLASIGYSRVDTVADPGEYAVRGSLLDVFPAGSENALRLDFFGDEVESIRRFDPADQRTIDSINAFTLLPVSETPLDADSIRRFRKAYVDAFGGGATGDSLYQSISESRRYAGQDHWLPFFTDGLTTLLDGYISQGATVILDSNGDSAAQARFEAITDYHDARVTALKDGTTSSNYKPAPAAKLYVPQEEWKQLAAQHPIHHATPFSQADALDYGVKPARDFAPERQSGQNVFDSVIAYVKDRQQAKKHTVLLCYSEGSRDRINGLLAEHGAGATVLVDSVANISAYPRNQMLLAVLPLEHGYETATHLFLTEQDVLGERLVRKRRKTRRADNFIRELSTLTPGDLVVHIDHGIGRYIGLQTITVTGAPHDCVQLLYADNAKLYVPVENIDVLSRYGSDSENTPLDRLGGAGWQARKAKLKERITAIAGELIKVAAARALRTAPQFNLQQGAYEEFSARFPYVETEDQARAIIDVVNDLNSGKPMDRLVCGDVGFGKTEVALRATLIAALEGVQVALICPTTLLARQHLANFQERFKGFPVRIGGLSRLIGTKDASQTKKDLADGTMDIVVGTHAVLNKTLSFKRLGLVIVDEEQHFGVTHKERLKQLREDVHVLTLTATPIPRTLQMALTGLRELSVIATPPVDRLAVRTYISAWDPVVVREALMREHLRGGQSFFVCPRIADLAEAEDFLKKHVPEVKVVIAHGQMAAGDIEDRISAFYDRRYDVLLSTTIVESGLDIPNANTLIIHRAEMFGLAQLYQLRGRVGRSKIRAYAYLTTSPDKTLTDTAQKRLKVLSSLDGLGAGFQLASHDLDIRGAGNLLGDEQSGHIKEIGFELYQQMLEDAIIMARASGDGLAPKDEEFSPQITVGASIMIPDHFVPDLSLRMALYRRMGDLGTRKEIDGFAAELIDRFGPLPDELKNLLQVIEIKNYCRIANVSKIESGPRGVIISFRNDRFENVPGLLDYVSKLNGLAKLRPDQKLIITKIWRTDGERLSGIMSIAKNLVRAARPQATTG
jgi:transcription-repair coupling factor (superfamily II helicase)